MYIHHRTQAQGPSCKILNAQKKTPILFAKFPRLVRFSDGAKALLLDETDRYVRNGDGTLGRIYLPALCVTKMAGKGDGAYYDGKTHH